MFESRDTTLRTTALIQISTVLEIVGGSGFSKTYNYCDEKNVKCGYEKEMDGFWFIFYRHDNVTTNVTDVTINVTKELSELELLIFEEIKKMVM